MSSKCGPEPKRKIDPEQPAFPVSLSETVNRTYGPPPFYSGVPIRLELAARFVAAMLTQKEIPLPDKAAEVALYYADVLIEEYNK